MYRKKVMTGANFGALVRFTLEEGIEYGRLGIIVSDGDGYAFDYEIFVFDPTGFSSYFASVDRQINTWHCSAFEVVKT